MLQGIKNPRIECYDALYRAADQVKFFGRGMVGEAALQKAMERFLESILRAVTAYNEIEFSGPRKYIQIQFTERKDPPDEN